MAKTPNENYQKEIKSVESLRKLSRESVRCPVGKCGETVSPSNLMMHILNKHEKTSLEIYDHTPIILQFDPKMLDSDGNSCMAVLCFGGVKDLPKTQPELSCLSLPNVPLIKNQHKFDNYLPILMMVCRTNWLAQIKEKEMDKELTSENGTAADIYIFWLVSPLKTRKLYYTLTAYDRYYHNSRSVIRAVRDFSSCQSPSDFMSQDDNYLLLRDSEIQELISIDKPNSNALDNQNRGILMELIVYENPLMCFN